MTLAQVDILANEDMKLFAPSKPAQATGTVNDLRELATLAGGRRG